MASFWQITLSLLIIHLIYHYMENKTSLSQFTLKYGIVTGLAIIVFSVIIYLLDVSLETQRNIGYIAWVILIVGMIWAIKDFRNKVLNGFISYGKAFSVSFLTGLFAGILASVWQFILMKFIDPGLVQKILDASEEQLMNNPDITEEQLEMAMSMTEKFTTPAMISVWSLVAYVIIALIIGLIISIFMKKEEVPA